MNNLYKKTFFCQTYGIVASGKSTLTRFIKKYKKLPIPKESECQIFFPEYVDFKIVATDKWREVIYNMPLADLFIGDPEKKNKLDPEKEKIVKEKVFTNIRKNLEIGQDTILDMTSLKKEIRDEVLEIVNNVNRPIIKILLVIENSLNEVIRRNALRKAKVPENVIENMYRTKNDPEQQPHRNNWDIIFIFNSEKIDLRELKPLCFN